MRKTNAGFSLVELMAAVLIVGVLAAIAYPSYQESVRKSNRAEGKAELMDLAQRLQRCYTVYGKFNDEGNCAVYKMLNDGGHVSPGVGFYEFKISDVTATTYTLTAAAIKVPQTADTNGCNELTLDEQGTKGPDGCW